MILMISLSFYPAFYYSGCCLTQDFDDFADYTDFIFV